MRTNLAREAGVPAPRRLGRANWPLAWYFAQKVGATAPERVRRVVGMLPALLDHVDELLDEGTIGGKQRDAADFQIGTSVRLLMTIEDLTPALRLARRHAGHRLGRSPSRSRWVTAIMDAPRGAADTERAMSQENVEIVRDALEVWFGTDIQAWTHGHGSTWLQTSKRTRPCRTSWADPTVPTPVPRAPLAASTRGGGGS